MPTVTLSVKIYAETQLQLVEHLLRSLLNGLDVRAEVTEISDSGWVTASISGDDQEAALKFLEEQIGLAFNAFQQVRKFSATKAYVTHYNRSRLFLDAGTTPSKEVEVSVSLEQLQAQLVDGRKLALERIAETYGLVEHLPMKVKVLAIDEETGQIKIALSEEQLSLYRNWTNSLLDRLTVLGSTASETKSAVRASGCFRDVVEIESIGLFEHAVACKLGTDAAGLIPKIGRRLPRSKFSVFSPRKTMQFLGHFY